MKSFLFLSLVFLLSLLLQNCNNFVECESTITKLHLVETLFPDSTAFAPKNCRSSFDRTYATCISGVPAPVKFTFHPFTCAAQGPSFGSYMASCDLYDSKNQSTSFVLCAKSNVSSDISVTNDFRGIIFYRVSDMSYLGNISVSDIDMHPAIAVDSASARFFFKTSVLVSCSIHNPSDCVRSAGVTGYSASSLLAFDGFLYAHWGNDTNTGLIRIRVDTWALSNSVEYQKGHGSSILRTLVHDDFYIYDICPNAVLARSFYNTTDMWNAGELQLGYHRALEMSISPDKSFLIVTAEADGLILVNTSTFSFESATILPIFVDIALEAMGRPIILDSNGTLEVYAFDQIYPVYVYSVIRVPKPVLVPVLYPLPGSPHQFPPEVNQVVQSCSSSSDGSFVACVSVDTVPVLFTFHPFAVAAVAAPASWMTTIDPQSCALYDTGNISTSILIFPASPFLDTQTPGTLYVFDVRAMFPHSVPTILLPGPIQVLSAVAVDSFSGSAYISDGSTTVTSIYKVFPLDDLARAQIVAIMINNTQGMSAMRLVSGVGLFGWQVGIFASGSSFMGLYRVEIAGGTFFFNKSSNNSFVVLSNISQAPGNSNAMAHNEWHIYMVNASGTILRVAYQPHLELQGKLDTSSHVNNLLAYTMSISPDGDYLAITSEQLSQLFLVSVASFTRHGDPVTVAPGSPSPIVTHDKSIFVFGQYASVYVFSYACHAFPEKECQLTEQCTFCRLASRCVDKYANSVCCCALGTADNCSQSGNCFWCGNSNSYFGQPAHSVDLCVLRDPTKSDSAQACSCAFLDKDVCSQEDVPCSWCDSIGICVDKNKYSRDRCSSPDLAAEACASDCFPCTWNEPVLLGASHPQSYCAVNPVSNCSSPPACNTINSGSAFDVRRQCEKSGCLYNEGIGKCSNQACFGFFVVSFVVLPLSLVAIGFVKDVIVLFLLGYMGDWLKRWIQRKTLRFTYWWHEWDKNKVVPNLDGTVYVNDTICRENNNNNNNGESFENYCKRVVVEMFDAQFDGIEDDEEKQRLMMRRILDAVAHAMFDSGLWFDLDNDDYGKIKEKENDENNNNCRYKCFNMPCGCRCCERQAEKDTEEEAEAKETINHEKLTITLDDTKSRFGLQKIVDGEIKKRATNVIFYASSRSARVRMAAALSSFPSSLSLFFYIISVIILFALTLVSVLQHRSIIERMSSFSCASSSTSGNSNSSAFAFGSSSEVKSTAVLLGFRLMNASAVATVMLLLVKTVRALWSGLGNGDRFNGLSLPQRLPIMNLFTSRATQGLLTVYFAIVLVFAFSGATFGLKLMPNLIVFGIAVAMMFLDVSVLTLLQRRCSFLALGKRTSKKDEPGEEVALLSGERSVNDTTLNEDRGYQSTSAKDDQNHANGDSSSSAESPVEHEGAVPLLSEPSRTHAVLNADDDEDDIHHDSHDVVAAVAADSHSQPSLGAADPSSLHLRRLFEPISSAAKSKRTPHGSKTSGNSYRNMPEENPATVAEIEDDDAEAQAVLAASRREIATNEASVTKLVSSFVLFLFRDEIPTVVLTIAFQAMYNFMCLFEYRKAFGIDDEMELFNVDFNAGNLGCMWNQFENNLSSIAALLTSFLPFA